MKARLFKYWNRLLSSFWFLPAIMAAGSVALAFATVALDEMAIDRWLRAWNWVYAGGAEGASAVLATIAGSMVTITGLVFSMTLVALTLASSQFGPRLLRNFMSDTTNQVVLGTFIATFLYCLLVLRTIRRETEVAFVPHLSVTLGVLLALVSMGVLIYFIHHVSTSIQADEIVARVGEELTEGIERLFPEHAGQGDPSLAVGDASLHLPDSFDVDARHVAARADGYLQFIDADALMDVARKHDLMMRLQQRPGQYVTAGRSLVLVWPGHRVTDRIVAQVNDAILVGDQRTPAQDVEFAVSQLVEIALRALSPGVNDPFTATRCVDRLGSAMHRLAQRAMPSPYRFDDEHRLRVVAPPVTFPAILDAAFNQIRQYANTSAAVTIRLLEAIAVIAESAHRPEDRSALRRHAGMIARGASDGLPEEEDRRAVEERLQAVNRVLERDVAPLTQEGIGGQELQ